MENALERLEAKREALYHQIRTLDDFRPGTISVRYRKCGKKNCVCYSKEHPGHGPQYLWTATRKGKSVAQNLRLGPELDKARREIATHQQFRRLSQEALDVNEQICRLRPVPEMGDQQELEALKKKLQRTFFVKRRKRLGS